MCDDDWINVAMADDSLVVELLLRLHQPHPPPPPKKTAPRLHLDWTVRQRRSRSAPRHLGSDKKDEPTRASPTTPFSWSCATSASGGGGAGAVDGYEESSRPTIPMQSSRSKIANPSETITMKKLRRKKTLVELKEEENMLLKEMKNLKNELASLRLTVEKHRAANRSLKRMKLDLETRKAYKTAEVFVATEKAIFDQPLLGVAQTHPSNDDVSANASSKAQEIRNLEASFLLPDLNLPVGEDLSSNAIHEIR